MATSMRALEGSRFSTAALRTIVAVDNPANAVDGATFKAASLTQKCLGAGVLYVMAGHNAAAGTMAIRLVFYDEDDAVIAISPSATVAATTLLATCTQSDGTTTNSRNLAQSSLLVPTGAFAARLFVETLTTSTAVDLYVGTDDPFVR